MTVLNHLVPRAYLEAIGDIVVSMNLLEWYLIDLLGAMSGMKMEKLRIFTSEMSSKNLRAAVSGFAIKESTEFRRRFKAIDARMEKLERRRNSIVHSVWAATGGAERSVQRLKFTAKGNNGLKLAQEPEDIKALRGVAEEMRNVAEEVMNLGKFLKTTQDKQA